MKKIEWRPQAEVDAADAAYWYARQGGLALGQRFLSEVDDTLARIAAFPGAGSSRHAHLAEMLAGPLRYMVVSAFDRYVIYYLDLPTHVDVVRVWCVERGLDALLDHAS